MFDPLNAFLPLSVFSPPISCSVVLKEMIEAFVSHDIVLKEVSLAFTLPLSLSFFPLLSIPHSIAWKDAISFRLLSPSVFDFSLLQFLSVSFSLLLLLCPSFPSFNCPDVTVMVDWA